MDLTIGIDPQRLTAAAQWAHDAYFSCNICPEKCEINRHAGQRGTCGLNADANVYKEYLHFGEEAVLTPSHTVFTSGCNFHCAFCSDIGPVKKPLQHGVRLSPESLADRIALRRTQGATNVNFVGGLPDVNLLYILRTLTYCPTDTHVVFNTNLWTTREAVEQLEGVVGTWLVDFKFGSNRCALKLAGIQKYLDHMHSLLPIISKRANVLVRHLVMPGHIDCCTRPVLAWMKANLPQVTVNLMTGYQPFNMAKGKGLMSRAAPDSDNEHAVRLADSMGLRYIINGVGQPPDVELR